MSREGVVLIAFYGKSTLYTLFYVFRVNHRFSFFVIPGKLLTNFNFFCYCLLSRLQIDNSGFLLDPLNFRLRLASKPLIHFSGEKK
jgi:hypothetical protein